MRLKKQLIEHYDFNKIKLLSNKVIDIIDKDIEQKYGFKSIRSEVKNNLPDSLFNALRGGFSNNLQKVKYGEDQTLAGVAAQFLFIGRALRAGYNASNVDLPSSKYDAILEKGNKDIVTIQIKGTDTGQFSFFSRPRGGQGIDSTHETNLGKRITSDQSDFYVAVDKRNGMCYIIPLNEIDKFSDDEVKALNKNDMLKYKEAWHHFDS